MLTSLRIKEWTPVRPQEKEARKKHPGLWLASTDRTVELHGQMCLLIWPQTAHWEARWVPRDNIVLFDSPATAV